MAAFASEMFGQGVGRDHAEVADRAGFSLENHRDAAGPPHSLVGACGIRCPDLAPVVTAGYDPDGGSLGSLSNLEVSGGKILPIFATPVPPNPPRS